jgi:hypothetical protein
MVAAPQISKSSATASIFETGGKKWMERVETEGRRMTVERKGVYGRNMCRGADITEDQMCDSLVTMATTSLQLSLEISTVKNTEDEMRNKKTRKKCKHQRNRTNIHERARQRHSHMQAMTATKIVIRIK